MTTLTYNGSSQLTTITDPAGRTLTLAYVGGLIYRITDTASPARTVSYSYDADRNLVQVIDARGGKTQFTYDTGHQVLTPTAIRARRRSPTPMIATGSA